MEKTSQKFSPCSITVITCQLLRTSAQCNVEGDDGASAVVEVRGLTDLRTEKTLLLRQDLQIAGLAVLPKSTLHFQRGVPQAVRGKQNLQLAV